MSQTARPLLRVWAVCFLLFLAWGFVWSIAVPLNTGPDEAAQVVKAAALVRGQWLGEPVAGAPAAQRRVRVPRTYQSLNLMAGCHPQLRPARPECARLPVVSSTSVSADTYVGRYPPLYYLIVGVPTLVTQGRASLYEMRWLSVLATAPLLAMAVAVLAFFGGGTLAPAAILVMATPIVFNMMGSVEPSALEIAAATCLWSCVVMIARRPDTPPPRALVGGAGVSAVVLALTRAASPLLLAAIGLVVAVVLVPPGGVRRLLKSRAVQIWLAVIGVVELAAVAWVLKFHSLDLIAKFRHIPKTAGAPTILRAELARTPRYLAEIVESFYPKDGQPWHLALIGSWVLMGLLVLLGWLVANRRERLVIGFFLLVELVAPLAIGLITFRRDGISWQGRYSLPLVIGAPIIAASALGRDTILPDLMRRLRVPSLVAGGTATALLVQFVALYGGLRHYTVGFMGTMNLLFVHPTLWTPPVSPTIIVCLAVAIVLFELVWFPRLLLTTLQRGTPVGGGSPRAPTTREDAEPLLTGALPRGSPPSPGP